MDISLTSNYITIWMDILYKVIAMYSKITYNALNIIVSFCTLNYILINHFIVFVQPYGWIQDQNMSVMPWYVNETACWKLMKRCQIVKRRENICAKE